MTIKASKILGLFGFSSTMLVIALSGCTADGTGGAAGAAEQAPSAPSADAQPKTLATLQLEEGHSVTFLELSPGSIMMAESGNVGTDSVLRSTGGAVLDVYRKLSKGGEPPEALVKSANTRVDPQLVQAVPPPPPSSEGALAAKTAASGRGARPMTTGADNAFNSQWCDAIHTSSCMTNWDTWLTTDYSHTNGYGQNSFTPSIRAEAMNEGTHNSVFSIMQWTASGWATKYSPTVAPGQWWYAGWFTSSPSWYEATQSATGGDEGLAIAVYDPNANNSSDLQRDKYYGREDLWFGGDSFIYDSSVSVTVKGNYGTWTEGNFPVTDSSTGTWGGSFAQDCPGGYFPTLHSFPVTAQGNQSGQIGQGTIWTSCEL